MTFTMLSVRCSTCGSPYMASEVSMRLHPNCPFCGSRQPQRFTQPAETVQPARKAAA